MIDTTKIINNYANKDKFKVNKVYSDSTVDDKPYGVESEYGNVFSYEWFKTAQEQQQEYEQLIGEVSRGEF